jgi:ribosome-associated heat shock protein Hsp15
MMRAAAGEDRDWQRLDKWLWCARFMRARVDCARLVADGRLRINRQPTDKPHAKLRVGDVITLPIRGEVRVIEVLALASRRGPADEAANLYHEIPPGLGAAASAALQCDTCGETEEVAYRAP